MSFRKIYKCSYVAVQTETGYTEEQSGIKLRVQMGMSNKIAIISTKYLPQTILFK